MAWNGIGVFGLKPFSWESSSEGSYFDLIMVFSFQCFLYLCKKLLILACESSVVSV